MDSQYVFPLLLALRLINALTLRTFFQPDEYFQALEPAWKLAFGEGSAAWITWEWRQHLRSAVHPALFSLILTLTSKVVSLLFPSREAHPHDTELYEAAPKILQAIIAALGDYYTWKLGERLYGRGSRPAWTTLLLTVFSPWQWFCSTRTFSNCLESTLTVYALYNWPFEWDFSRSAGSKRGTYYQQQHEVVNQRHKMTTNRISDLRRALFCAAIATILRPTNIIIWVTLAALGFVNGLSEQSSSSATTGKSQSSSPAPWANAFILLREGIVCGGVVLSISAVVDRAFYQVWTFPPYNFLYFNVVQSLAVFYGNNDWHYYLSQGYPLLLIAALPFTLLGLHRTLRGTSSSTRQSEKSTRTALRHLSVVCLMLPLALSILSHKEVRFIYPLLPFLHVITALPLSEFARNPLAQRDPSTPGQPTYLVKRNVVLAVLIALNVTVAYYVSYIHNSGILTLSTYLRHEFETHHFAKPQQSPSAFVDKNRKNMTVGFLMPCHSTPWRSHLQYPPSASTVGIQAWALTCEPPLHITNPAKKRTYRDEADLFYDNPREWLHTNMAVEASSPDSFNNKDSRATALGQDITDLLPHLITHPPSSSSPSISNVTAKSPTTTTSRRAWPDYLIFFAALEPTLHNLNIHHKTFFRAQSQNQLQLRQQYQHQHQHDKTDHDTKEIKVEVGQYQECFRHFNSHFHDDWRRVGDVVVWCMN